MLISPLTVGDSGAAVVPISGAHRLLEGFVEDGAIVKWGWIELLTTYQDRTGGRDLSGALITAFRLGRDIEAGAVVGLLERRRDAGAILFGSSLADPVSDSGLADVLLYGKYRGVRSPIELAIGGAVEVPVGDEAAGLGSGAFQYRGFVALRRDLYRASIVASLGVADRQDSEAAGRAAGQTSIRVGAGLLVPLSLYWTVIGEASYESARFDGDEADGRALIGLDWRPTEFLVMRGGAGGGWTDGAPDLSLVLSMALQF